MSKFYYITSPIYYVNDMGVPLIEYMWYKNILAIIFGVISLMNGLLVDKFGCKNCFFFIEFFAYKCKNFNK